MGQYQTGTVTISHNSPTVTGNNTTWVTDGIQAGWIFTIKGENNIYWISSVDDETQITLAQNYLNPDAEDIYKATYAIVQDYTDNYEWPKLSTGDYNWTEILRRSMHEIDKDFYTRYSKSIIFGVTPSGEFVSLSGQSIYVPHSSVVPRKGKMFYDDYHKAFLYYTGRSIS
jgi:hypothetical protein